MMIAIIEKPRQDQRKQANDRFLEMLPRIRRRAQIAFHSVPSEHKEELVQEAVANAYIAFVQLVDRGRASATFATPLADYAIRRVLAARLAGSGLSSSDVLSRAARFGSGIVVESLDTFDDSKATGALRWLKIGVPGRLKLRPHASTLPPGFVRSLPETVGLPNFWPGASQRTSWRSSLS